ncbi:MAG: tetratricopeptide repeat protein [Candidatus Obscuribacter sp.]|nr:tetratricopeptide repeat protein [Candidatus Obscuribacter sp.]
MQKPERSKLQTIQNWQRAFKTKVLDNPKYIWYRRGVYGITFAYALFLAVQSTPYYGEIGSADAAYKRGDYPLAEHHLKRAYSECQKFGANYLSDKRTVRATNNLAELYREQGRYREAEPFYKLTIESAKVNFGPNRPETAVIHNNFAACLREMGRFDEAEAEYKTSIDLWQNKVKQPDSTQYAKLLAGYAKLKCERGDYQESLKLYNQALGIVQKNMGKNDVQNAYLLANIGRVYLDTRDMDKAAEYYKAAEKLDLAALGSDHPDTACDYNNLASLYREQGKYPESEQYFAKTLKVRLAKLGPNHRLTAKTLMGMAELKRLQKDYAAAQKLALQALAIQKKSSAG